MAKQRREEQVRLAVERSPLVRLGVLGPRGRLDRMRRRSEGQDVEDHRLVVAAPVPGVHSFLGIPPHADRGRARLRPLPVRAPIQFLRRVANRFLGRIVAIEVRLREERAGEQQRTVDRRQLHLLESPAGVHVEEVVVEAVVRPFAVRQ